MERNPCLSEPGQQAGDDLDDGSIGCMIGTGAGAVGLTFGGFDGLGGSLIALEKKSSVVPAVI